MTYDELKQALEIFSLNERATLKQIKARHRALAKGHHPDMGSEGSPRTMTAINSAYALLTSYCQNYCYSFSEEEFLEQVPEERLRRQFDWPTKG